VFSTSCDARNGLNQLVLRQLILALVELLVDRLVQVVQADAVCRAAQHHPLDRALFGARHDVGDHRAADEILRVKRVTVARVGEHVHHAGWAVEHLDRVEDHGFRDPLAPDLLAQRLRECLILADLLVQRA
jgi:hypothetical protein